MTLETKHISVVINRNFNDVYKFASNPEFMPQWAAGLSGSIKREDDHWVSESPMGKVIVRFTPENDFGIIDHEVVIPGGKTFYNPLRVIRNESGSEIIFTLFRQEEMTDTDFKKDGEMILSDLKKLKSILES